MRVVLQYFNGCPNWRVADERLRDALAEVGAASEIVYQVVETPEHAARVGFTGSPTNRHAAIVGARRLGFLGAADSRCAAA